MLPVAGTQRAESAGGLHVVVDATSVRLPLVVSGASLEYRDVDRALAQSLEKSALPQLEQLATRRRRALALSVELVEARAEYAHGRLLIELAVRATLRERAGNVYLAQTQAHHAASAVSEPERGAPTVIECADAISAELAGWLAGVDLH